MKQRQQETGKVLLGKGVFGRLDESASLLGSRLGGKKVAFVVDEGTYRSECIILPLSVFKKAGVEGRVILYRDFFGSEPVSEVLILRSSRIFWQHAEDLKASLERFRKGNPDAAVVLCASDPNITEELVPLLGNGSVNVLVPSPGNDYDLLRIAADVLERIRQSR